MTPTSAHSPLIYMPSGYTHLTYQDFSNEIFIVGECDLGLGMFANKDIAKDEIVLTFTGPFVDFKETKTRGPWECMPIQVGIDLYIDTLPPGVFVNHSCAPNAGIKRDGDLVALRSIAKGEEIRFDYSTTMEEQSFTMECKCAHPDCRRIIADFSTLPESKKIAYLGDQVVMSFIAQHYPKVWACPRS